MKQIHCYPDKKTQILIYHAIFVPHLFYSSLIWAQNSSSVKRLDILQKQITQRNVFSKQILMQHLFSKTFLISKSLSKLFQKSIVAGSCYLWNLKQIIPDRQTKVVKLFISMVPKHMVDIGPPTVATKVL